MHSPKIQHGIKFNKSLNGNDVDFLCALYSANSNDTNIDIGIASKIEQPMTKLINLVNQYFKQMNRHFEKALKNLHFHHLKTLLDIMQLYDSKNTIFITKLKDMKGVNFSGVKFYDEMIDLIIGKLNKLQESIIEHQSIVC